MKACMHYKRISMILFTFTSRTSLPLSCCFLCFSLLSFFALKRWKYQRKREKEREILRERNKKMAISSASSMVVLLIGLLCVALLSVANAQSPAPAPSPSSDGNSSFSLYIYSNSFSHLQYHTNFILRLIFLRSIHISFFKINYC